MTTFRTVPDQRLDVTRQALLHMADAWGHGLAAARLHDEHEARRVLRGAPARRTLLRAAHHSLLRTESPRGLGLVRRSTPSDVVADLVRMNTLLSRLSQVILSAPDEAAPGEHVQGQLRVAGQLGARRLEHFAATMPRPVIDRAYISAGHELLDTLANLAEDAPRRGTAQDICLSLMVVLVETSRHATHIA